MRYSNTLSLVVLCVTTIAAQQPSPREQAKQGDVTLVINNEYAPATLEEITAEADAVIIGAVASGTAILGDNDRQVFTDYRVSITRVLKNAQPRGLVPGDELIVRRWGGAMSLEGHNVVAEENDFQPFSLPGSYVLFLQAVPTQSFYYVAGGPQGAFRIRDNHVTQVSTKFGTWNKEHGEMALTAFVSEVRRVMALR